MRWLNGDPLREGGGINVYGFVGNSAINFVDLWGLELVGASLSEATAERYGVAYVTAAEVKGLFDADYLASLSADYNMISIDSETLAAILNNRDDEDEDLRSGRKGLGVRGKDLRRGKRLMKGGVAIGAAGAAAVPLGPVVGVAVDGMEAAGAAAEAGADAMEGVEAASEAGEEVGSAAEDAASKLPRYDGPKPRYVENPAHGPGPTLRPGKTPLPSDAEATFGNAVPNDPVNPTAWFGENANGQVYRYSVDRNGTAHFSGTDGVGSGVRNFTNYARKRLGL